MTQVPSTRAPARLRRVMLLAVCAVSLGGIAATLSAQEVPAGLRACAADSDPGRRLDCYDREMKRLMAPPARTGKAESPARPAKAGPPVTQPAPAHADLSSRAPMAGPDARNPTSGAAKASDSEPAAAPERAPMWKRIFNGGAPSHVTAHIARLDRWPNAMVLHLDNGQVWRQVGRASGDLSLRTGDEVTIEKRLGSYWLSSRHVSEMRVRLER